MELGSQAWLDRCRARINDSDSFRDAAEGWTCSLGLAFLDGEGQVRHHARLELVDGRCEAAEEVPVERFEAAPVRLSADDDTWQRVLEGDLNPIKAIMLRRVRLDGDLLHVVKHALQARELFACAAGPGHEARPADAG